MANPNLPLSSYVKQLEMLLDEGYYVEYVNPKDGTARHQGDTDE